jgi:prepilin-type N-terminal cleavage/methylation domain-containing protein
MFKELLARAKEARAAELEGEGGLEGGFTLIELMVVLLIIAILLAIAIPTFLGVSGGARDRAAQSNLTNALTDGIAYYQNAQTYDATQQNTACSQTYGSGCTGGQATTTALQAQEPAFTWVGGGTNLVGASSTTCPKGVGNCVSVLPVDVSASNDGNGLILAVLSGNSSTCWYALNMQSTPAAYTSGGPDVATGTGVFSGQTSIPTTASSAGTYYAKVTNATTCDASAAQAFTTWGTSYANAPVS